VIGTQRAQSSTGLAQDSGEAVGNAAQIRISYDFTGNGNWDRVADFGTTTVEWRAYDRAGNFSAWTAPQVVRIDWIPPNVTADRPPGEWSTGPVTFTATATDVGSGVAGYLYETATGNGVWSAPQPGDAVTITAEGTTCVRFAAYDSAGNRSPWANDASSVTCAGIDATPPTLTTPYGAGRWMHYTSGVITYASDAESGVASVEYDTSTDGGLTWSDPQPGNEAWISQEGVSAAMEGHTSSMCAPSTSARPGSRL